MGPSLICFLILSLFGFAIELLYLLGLSEPLQKTNQISGKIAGIVSNLSEVEFAGTHGISRFA
jgi:hypothetical protein